MPRHHKPPRVRATRALAGCARARADVTSLTIYLGIILAAFQALAFQSDAFEV